MPKLSDFKREIFAQHFVANGFNSIKAARAAGYTASASSAAGLRRHPEIEERIRELLADQMAELQVDALAVKRQISRIAFADPRALFNEHGHLIPIGELDDDTAATIAGIEVEVKKDRDGNHVCDLVKIKRHSSLDALVFLGKHFKLVGDDNDGVNAFANALADRLNAAKRRTAARAVDSVIEDAAIIEPARLEATSPEAVPLSTAVAGQSRPEAVRQHPSQESDDERLW